MFNNNKWNNASILKLLIGYYSSCTACRRLSLLQDAQKLLLQGKQLRLQCLNIVHDLLLTWSGA